MVMTLATTSTPTTVTDAHDSAVRSFSVDIPEADLVDLHTRVSGARWPGKEPVADQSQGVQLTMLRELARYWGTDYDLRRLQA
jgi:hypothetical protein